MDDGNIRAFDTGATRDTASGKLDPEGFTHPMVMKQFYKFMNMHRLQSNGELRDSDNWQKGIPLEVYAKSLRRHYEEFWATHRGFESDNGITADLCGILFNAMGYLHENLKATDWKLIDFDGDDPIPEIRKRKEDLEEDELDDLCDTLDWEPEEEEEKEEAPDSWMNYRHPKSVGRCYDCAHRNIMYDDPPCETCRWNMTVSKIGSKDSYEAAKWYRPDLKGPSA